jgi:hypothetical protein
VGDDRGDDAEERLEVLDRALPRGGGGGGRDRAEVRREVGPILDHDAGAGAVLAADREDRLGRGRGQPERARREAARPPHHA